MKTENKAVPTVDEVQTATSALDALHAKMAFLRPLTAPERRQDGTSMLEVEAELRTLNVQRPTSKGCFLERMPFNVGRWKLSVGCWMSYLWSLKKKLPKP